MNKKGKINFTGEQFFAVIAVFVLIIVVINIYSVIVPDIQSVGDQFTDATACNNAGCFFNETCLINSSVEGQGVACNVPVNTTPLGNLFGAQGIVLLLVIAGLFFFILGVLPLFSRNKK